MPELPEVETVCRGLARAVQGQKIARIETFRHDLRIPFPKDLNSITGLKIKSIERRAKYILLHLSGQRTLILHLGMSGSLTIRNKKEPCQKSKHDHMLIFLQDDQKITFNDPRRFGLVALTDTKNIDQSRFFRHLGPEPFDRAFNAFYLAEKLKSRKIAVKLAIMDQQLVVGVGNIYASESLFMAGIDPLRKSSSLNEIEIKKLVAAIQKVLKRAIAAGGSSLRNYVQADGELGYFQHQWAVYGKPAEKCKGCTCNIKKTGGIQKTVQGGRATFYCPEKQR